MPDESTAPSGAQGAPAGAGAPNAGGPQGGQQGQQGQGPGAPGGSAGAPPPERSPEEWARLLSERETENARYRERIRAAEAADAERQRAGMDEVTRMRTDLEQATARRAELERELARRDLSDQATQVATTLGFRNPTLASRLVDLEAVRAEDGKLDKAKLEAHLQAELRANPYLGNGGAGDGGAGRGGPPPSSMDAFIRSRARGH